MHMKRYHAAKNPEKTKDFREWDSKRALPRQPFCVNLRAVLDHGAIPEQSKARDGRWRFGNDFEWKKGHIHSKPYPCSIETGSWLEHSVSNITPDYDGP